MMGPVIECSQFVEGDVANKCMALRVERHRDISRHLVICRGNARRRFPRAAAITRIGCLSIVLKDCDNMLFLVWIDRDGRLSKWTRLRSERKHFGPWSFAQGLAV